MMPTPCDLQLADDPEQPVDLLVAERGGRLVHDQDAGVGPQGPRDLDQLLLGHRQPADLGLRVDRRADPFEQAAAPASRRSPQRTRRQPPPGSSPMAMFSATVRSGNSAGCW